MTATSKQKVTSASGDAPAGKKKDNKEKEKEKDKKDTKDKDKDKDKEKDKDKDKDKDHPKDKENKDSKDKDKEGKDKAEVKDREKQKSKVLKDESPPTPPEPVTISKTTSEAGRDESDYRAMVRKERFKRRWPEVTKVSFKTKPWRPPPPPQRPPPVVIELPHLKTRQWVPPYTRPREPRPKLPRIPPDQMTQPLPSEPSKLRKIWHNFSQVDKNKMILQGHVGCNSKKYSSTHCGAQTGCIAVACRALLDEKVPAQFVKNDVDELIETGDRYYKQCMIGMKCYKGKPALQLNQLLTSFYYHDTKYTVKLLETDQGLLAKHPDNIQPEQDLMALMEKRVGTPYMLILTVGGDRHFLIWGHPPDPETGSQAKTICYIFDPHMLNEEGQVDKLSGAGAFLRFAGVTSFVLDFLANYGDLDAAQKGTPKPPITLTSVEVVQKERLIREPDYALDLKALKTHCRSEWDSLNINALIDKKREGQYPFGSLSAISLATSKATPRRKMRDFYQKMPKEPIPVPPVQPDKAPLNPTNEQIMTLRGENFFLYSPRLDGHTFGRDDMIPLPKSETVLHSPVEIADQNYHSQYKQLDVEKWILRGTRHMASYRYQIFKTYTAIPCCVAALGMLRRYRARAWNEDMFDETLDIGYNLFRESLVERGGPIRRLVLGELKDTFKIRDREYKHKVRGIAVWGKLISNNPKVFDVCRGLEHFFKESDSGILQVPGEYEVAIWYEGGKYYLYHPWPADRYGNRVGLQDGGKGCVMYFPRVSRLCEYFLDNVSNMKRKPFSISDVAVWQQSVDMPEPVNKMKRKRITLVRGDILYQSTMEHLERMGIGFDTPKNYEEGGGEEEVGGGEPGESASGGTLAAADVLNRFKVSEYDCIETDVMDSAFTGSLNPESGGAPNLTTVLKQFFKEHTHGVFTARGGSTAIWKHDGHFYFFDPHGCDENGLPSDEPRSTACLVRIKGKVDELADVLLSNLAPGSDDSFNISPVAITATKLNAEIGAPETKLESKAYEWINKGTAAIMMGPRGENSAIGKAAEKAGINADDMAGRTIGLPAAAAFAAATESVPPPHMHQDHMFNFLEAGAEYYLNHLKKTGRKEITPEDLTEKFEMGANTFHIELGEAIKLPLRLPDEEPGEGEGGGGGKEGLGEGEEEEKVELKHMKDLLFKMWYDTTKPTTISLLLGDYHQLGVWMAAGGKVVAFDPAPTMTKGLLTSQRIKKGDELRLQRLADEMTGEGAGEPGEEDDEEAGGEGEEKPEPEQEEVPLESCPVLIVAASPGEFIDKLTRQGGLDGKQCLAPYKLYPVKVINELTSMLKEKRGGPAKDRVDEGEEGGPAPPTAEELVPALDDAAMGKYMDRLTRSTASVRARLAQNENYFMDQPNRDNQVKLEVEPDVIGGDTKAGENGSVNSLKKAITSFFSNELADTFRANVDNTMRPGDNKFSISAVKVFWEFSKLSTPVTPQGTVPDEGYEWKVLTAFVETARGRTILRGTRPPDLMKSVCVCVRAPVDEVMSVACQLFTASLGSLGYEFRPGEDVLLPLQVLKRFVLGVNYVRYDLEEVFSGKLEQKEPSQMTVRCALERFFEAHTHGILWSVPHAVCIWRVAGAPSYYMFEPHACGPTGLRVDAMDDGAACVLTFTSPKLMAFAYLQNVPVLERPKHDFQLYAMSITVQPIKKLGGVEPPIVRAPPGAPPGVKLVPATSKPIKKLGVEPPIAKAPSGVKLVPATSKVGIDGSKRRASEKDRKHPPGSATCLDAQRAAEKADKEQTKLKGRFLYPIHGYTWI
ncbi:hypothetical protein B5X24_HaOG210400 [Helicoverpa armigera]|uniref:Uncharacterized protein n=1 Tax=Helicoverpa armigera TaxID=29058 RepID=A0A2W1BGN9_HELAM|nr:hypothetical protein B5X24_HaOG210400 [Helicoverpa armigera]